LTVLRAIAYPDDGSLTSDRRLKYMPPSIRTMWNPKNDFRFRTFTKEDFAKQRKLFQTYVQLVRDMHGTGGRFLGATDVLNPYCFPGFSLHDEMEMLVTKCGFTPLEALQTATRNPAEYLGRLKDLGTVEQGKRADLVLLDANPLDDIRNTTKIRAVVFNGRLLPRSRLDSLLAKVESAWKEKPKAVETARTDTAP